MSTREQNERNLPDGGRRYRLDVIGRSGWWARYVKEVDINETTTRFYQEIYNENGRMIEVHLKYPVDVGHQKV